jgi:hypothetical protein
MTRTLRELNLCYLPSKKCNYYFIFSLINRAKPIRFDKILPRDNKMFFISEGYNLDQKEDPFIEKFLLMDMVSKNQRNNHGNSNLLNHSSEMANNIEDIDKFLYSRNLSLEEKILSGYYKV